MNKNKISCNLSFGLIENEHKTVKFIGNREQNTPENFWAEKKIKPDTHVSFFLLDLHTIVIWSSETEIKKNSQEFFFSSFHSWIKPVCVISRVSLLLSVVRARFTWILQKTLNKETIC